jgi:geranylgeranyl reductase family protein
MTAPAPPLSCEVLVVGAGPAGSAAALCLARAGVQVLLVDQHRFPRDKVCGDALIPDAHAALQRLDVLDEVLARAQAAQQLRCVSPSGRALDVPGTLAVLPRRELDLLLCDAAQRAGARFLAPARFEAPLLQDGRVAGALLRTAPGDDGPGTRQVQARWVVLATGAVPQALQAAGLCLRTAPSGVALRAYIRHPGLARTLQAPQVVWHPRLQHGYGWVFPGPDGVFNLGTGVMHSPHRPGRDNPRPNLRHMLDAFAQIHAPARQLLAEGERLGPLKGAPLRCSLRGAAFSRPGLLVAGEAAGSTYALTGEGIGKALETGIAAAQALLHTPGALQAPTSAGACTAVRQSYETGLQALQPRFDVYESAAKVNRWPWLTEFLLWRAARSPRILARMAGVLAETQSPRLFSLRGMGKLLTE